VALASLLPTPKDDPETVSNSLQPDGLITEAKLRELERRNMLKALQITNWKISGPNGAATLLGLKPSTFTYRMKVLKIEK